jgi:uncharacterized protein (TIGR03790 family)
MGSVYVDWGWTTSEVPSSDVPGSYEAGELNLLRVADVFDDYGWSPIVEDSGPTEFGTAPAALDCPDALFYAGWYTYGLYNDVFSWAPGAIGAHLDSCSACDLRSGQNWSAVALQRGITATFGAVNEPYIFLYLSQGASFGEAAAESTYVSRWMMVWVGDPWYRPLPL